MTRVAIRFAPKQIVTGHLLCSHRVLAGQKRIEFRGEGADILGSFEEIEGLSPVIIDIVCFGAIVRTERDWRGGREIPSRSGAGSLDVARPIDVEIRAPDLLEQ